ncbi:MAG TPA: MFS transporter [Polyangia bacterium]|nr:MFS transporter [Polyangia bacterium]
MSLPQVAPSLTRKQKRLILLGTMLALFLGALDQTIVATAGPIIQCRLHIAPSVYIWITASYLVASLVMVPVYGKLSDQIGRKPILLVGLSLFLVGTLLCGLATGAPSLIAFRALQGLGAASLFSGAFSVIADVFLPHERAMYQGFLSAVFGMATIIGPVVGGVIASRFGWQWAFFFNLPLGLLALAVIGLRMPHILPPEAARGGGVDVLGVLLLAVGVGPLLVALTFGRSHIAPGNPGFLWSSSEIRGLFLLSALGLIAFVLAERRAKNPIVDFSLYAQRVYGYTNAAQFLLGASFLAGIVFLPLFMVEVLGASATRAGLPLVFLSLGISFGAATGGRMAVSRGRCKPPLLMTVGALTIAYGVMGATLAETTSSGSISLRMLIIGLCTGPTFPLYTIAVQNSLPRERLGVATSGIGFARSLGQVVGLALLGTIFTSVLAAQGAAARTTSPACESVAATSAEASAPTAAAAVAAGNTSPPRDATTRAAYTLATARLYQISALLALVAFLFTLAMPDVRFGPKWARPQAAPGASAS